jgi:hypothetical protein
MLDSHCQTRVTFYCMNIDNANLNCRKVYVAQIGLAMFGELNITHIGHAK